MDEHPAIKARNDEQEAKTFVDWKGKHISLSEAKLDPEFLVEVDGLIECLKEVSRGQSMHHRRTLKQGHH